jgi:hypothetical protein
MRPRSRKSDKEGIERGEMMRPRSRKSDKRTRKILKLKKARKHLISCGCVEESEDGQTGSDDCHDRRNYSKGDDLHENSPDDHRDESTAGSDDRGAVADCDSHDDCHHRKIDDGHHRKSNDGHHRKSDDGRHRKKW